MSGESTFSACLRRVRPTQQLIICHRTAHCLPLANLQACSSLIPPHRRILSLEPLRGGFISKYLELVSVHNFSVFRPIDYDSFSYLSSVYQPSIIFANSSFTSTPLNYSILQRISRQNNAHLIADISSDAGIVAAGLLPSPFRHVDMVTMSTQGSLCGPRGALIFYRRELQVPRLDWKDAEGFWKLDRAVNAAVIPWHQGGPHAHAIAGIAIALKQASSLWFRTYQEAGLANAAALQDSLRQNMYSVHGGGGQTPIVAVEVDLLKSAEEKLNQTGLELGPVVKGEGVLLGSTTLTFRGFGKHDFERVADILDHVLQITRAYEVASTAQSDQQSGGGLGERSSVESEAALTSLKREVKSLIDSKERYLTNKMSPSTNVCRHQRLCLAFQSPSYISRILLASALVDEEEHASEDRHIR